MTKARLIVLVCFCTAFAAGVAANMAWTRFEHTPRRHSWIASRLDLSPEQAEQMRDIWSGTMRHLREQHREQRRLLRQERDDAIQALMTEEQKLRYQDILLKYSEKVAALDEGRTKAYEDAEERTKQILSEDQRKRYEELLKQRSGRGSHRGGPPGARSSQKGDRTPAGGGE